MSRLPFNSRLRELEAITEHAGDAMRRLAKLQKERDEAVAARRRATQRRQEFEEAVSWLRGRVRHLENEVLMLTQARSRTFRGGPNE